MVMSYEKFNKLIPNRTKDFVDLSLKYLYFYLDKRIMDEESNFTVSDLNTRIFISLLCALYRLEPNCELLIYLENNRLNTDLLNSIEYYDMEINQDRINELFNRVNNIFCVFDDEVDFISLIPEKIISKFSVYDLTKSSLETILPIDDYDPLFYKFREYCEQAELECQQKIEQELYKDLSYELIEYLKKAGLIFNKYNEKRNKNVLIKTTDDIIIASLLVSLELCDDIMYQYFIAKNIITDKFLNDFIGEIIKNNNLFVSEIDDRFIVNTLKMYFSKYLFDGLNKNIDRKDLTIEKVIRNIFDRNFTNSMLFEHMINESGLSLNDFVNFEEDLKKYKINYEHQIQQEKIGNFFDDASNEAIDFLKLVFRINITIENNLNNGLYNKKYLNTEENISLLSFFIASYYVPNEYVCYFKSHGISINKIMEKLGLNINEIPKINVDMGMIFNKYKNTIFNSCEKCGKNINDILYIVLNLTKTDILKKLCNDINPNFKISNEIQNEIAKFNNNLEELRCYQLEQHFFEDMPRNSVKFTKMASQFSEEILNNQNSLPEPIRYFNTNDIIEIAIFVTAVRYFKDYKLTIEFFKSLIDSDRLLFDVHKLNNCVRNYNDNSSINIDLINKYFGKYLFEGNNKNKAKKDITIKDIYTNIFNKELNNSANLYNYLAKCNFDYDKFRHFDESFLDFEKDKKIAIMQQKINEFDDNYREYFNNLIKIYKHLFNLKQANKIDYDKEEIKKISRLLALLEQKKYDNPFNVCVDLLSKRGITVDNYLKFLNIDIDDFNQYKNIEYDYVLFYDEFSYNDGSLYWMLADVFYDIQNIRHVIKLFQKENGIYLYEDFIKSLNQNPEIIEEEMEKGEKIITPMSKEEQLNYLTTTPISKLDYSLSSISSFGRELAEHSMIIANEFVSIAMPDDSNESMIDIQDEISKISRKPSLFARKKKVSEKIAQNKAVLDKLNEILKQNETRMIEEIEHFNYLKKLLAAYIYRLNCYIEELKGNIANFNKEGSNQNSNTLENMDYETIFQVLSAKLNDYQTSLIVSIQQYQKINLLLNTTFINLNKTATARNTIIPNLYIELSIRDGLLLEQDSINDLNSITELLNDTIKVNNQILDRNTFKIKKGQVSDDEISTKIKEVLTSENLPVDTKYTDSNDNGIQKVFKDKNNSKN